MTKEIKQAQATWLDRLINKYLHLVENSSLQEILEELQQENARLNNLIDYYKVKEECAKEEFVDKEYWASQALLFKQVQIQLQKLDID